jgi:CheY-like chemotaxis protein
MSETRPKAVLMVDDSAEDAELMQAAIQEARTPCFFKAVTSADAARAYLEGQKQYADRAAHPFPSLVLLDIQMPGKDGFAVLQWLRSQKPDWHGLPVIMLTTSHDYAEIKRAYDLGANSFLVKPTGFKDLAKLVSDLLAYWLSHNRVIPVR